MAKRRKPILRFFRRKLNLMDDTQTSVVEETVVEPAPVVEPSPVTETPEEVVRHEVAPLDPVFNCVACGGQGLKDQNAVCPVCNGTGRVG